MKKLCKIFEASTNSLNDTDEEGEEANENSEIEAKRIKVFLILSTLKTK